MHWRSVKCPYCGDENPRDKNYCSNCGKPLGVFEAESPAEGTDFIAGPRLQALMEQDDALLWFCNVECKLETRRLAPEGETFIEEWAGNQMALTRKLLVFFQARRKGNPTEAKVLSRTEMRGVREEFTWWPGNMRILVQVPEARWKIRLAAADGEKILELLSKSSTQTT